MFASIVATIVVAGVIKLVAAACGHRATWRMAILLAIVVGVLAVYRSL